MEEIKYVERKNSNCNKWDEQTGMFGEENLHAMWVADMDFTAPDEVIRDLIMNVRNSEGYSDSKGIFSARKAIMQYCQLKGFPNVDIDDIYIGNGVSEMISISMQALLDDGDEVLVPMPDYPLWTACISLAGGNAVHYVCDEKSNWYPDIDDIKSKITSNTKAIVVINPNNPTGAVYPKEILEQIVQIARACFPVLAAFIYNAAASISTASTPIFRQFTSRLESL